MTEKTAVAAPMPRARERMAVRVRAGRLRNSRMAWRRSVAMSMRASGFVAGWWLEVLRREGVVCNGNFVKVEEKKKDNAEAQRARRNTETRGDLPLRITSCGHVAQQCCARTKLGRTKIVLDNAYCGSILDYICSSKSRGRIGRGGD